MICVSGRVKVDSYCDGVADVQLIVLELIGKARHICRRSRGCSWQAVTLSLLQTRAPDFSVEQLLDMRVDGGWYESE